MKLDRLNKIKEDVELEKEIADKIMEGDHDGYDGADGARTVRVLCKYITELIDEVEIEK